MAPTTTTAPGAFAHAAVFIWDPPPSVVWPTPAPRCRPELAHPAVCTGVLPHSLLMAGCDVPERSELHWQVAQGAVTACAGTKLPGVLYLLSTVALAPGKAPEDAPAMSSKHAGEHGIQGPSSLSRCILEPNLTLDSLSLVWLLSSWHFPKQRDKAANEAQNSGDRAVGGRG